MSFNIRSEGCVEIAAVGASLLPGAIVAYIRQQESPLVPRVSKEKLQKLSKIDLVYRHRCYAAFFLSSAARLAKATKQAVANWRLRYDDFPRPLQQLQSGPVAKETLFSRLSSSTLFHMPWTSREARKWRPISALLKGKEMKQNPRLALRVRRILQRAKLEAIKAPLPASSSRQLDVYLEFSRRGEESFARWLESRSISELEEIIRLNEFDPSRRAAKWKQPERLATFIANAIRSRKSRGSGFMRGDSNKQRFT